MLAGAAVVDALRGGEGTARTDPAPPPGEPVRERSLAGPLAPPPGALPGTLVLALGPECALRELDLASEELGPAGDATGCRIWPSPRGDSVVVQRAGSLPDGYVELVLLHRAPKGVDPDPPLLLGRSLSAPAFSDDGGRVAWCRDRETVVLELATEIRSFEEGCFPVFASDGGLLTRVDERRRSLILRDGEPVLVREDAAGENVNVLGHGITPDGRIAIAVSGRAFGAEGEAALELWSGGRLETALPIASYGPAAGFFGVDVEFGPGGVELAVTFPETLSAERPPDLVAFLDRRLGAIESLAARSFAGLAWSPDGGWLALATGRELLVYGAGRTDATYEIPLAARAVAWLP